MLKFLELKNIHNALRQYMIFFEDVKIDEFNILLHGEDGHFITLTIKNNLFDLEKVADEKITAITHEDGTDLISWLEMDKDKKCQLVNDAFQSWITPLFRDYNVKSINQIPKPEELCHCIWFSSVYSNYFVCYPKKISLQNFDYNQYCLDGRNAQGGLSISRDLYSRNILHPSDDVRKILQNYKVYYKLIECTEEKQYRMMQVSFLRNKEWATSRVEIST